LYSSESSSWKIADFGLTSEATSNHFVTTRYGRGKPCYRAPELISELPFYNNKVDIWSLGCIICELLTGKKRFSGDYAVLQYMMDDGNRLRLLDERHSPDDEWLLNAFFVTYLLSRDPRNRPSVMHLESLYQIPIVLLQSGVSISNEGFEWTALDVLSATDRMDLVLGLVETMLTAGIDFGFCSSYHELGKKLLLRAATNRERKLIKALLTANLTLTDLTFDAVLKGDLNMIEFLLECGAEIELRNHNDETLLHCAALAGQVGVLKFLLGSGANVHAVVREDNSGLTPLHYAAVGGDPEVVKILLQVGADPYATSNKGVTVLNIAALNIQTEVVKLLLPYDNREMLSELYDLNWTERYKLAWDGSQRTREVDMYDLPLHLKRTGAGWYALFNKDITRDLDISLVHILHIGSAVTCVCFSKDANYVAAATKEAVKIFQIRSGNMIGSIVNDCGDGTKKASSRPHPFKCICFDPNTDSDIVTGGDAIVISVWDIRAQRIKRLLVGHESRILSLEISRSGCLVSAANDRTVRLWDLRSGHALLTVKTDRFPFCNVAISPNAKIIAAVSFKPEVRRSNVCLWNEDGVLLETFTLEATEVVSLAFSPTGEELVTGSYQSINNGMCRRSGSQSGANCWVGVASLR
jgi:Protein kinase domain/Ankyrin repeats (3 copies)/WD domain, G-beta repeat